jgi:glycosidase/predicted alpha/beta superfamily hydrolase
MTRRVLTVLLLLASIQVHAAYRIDHLEPSSWWIGMKDNRVQLLVHGKGVSELEPAVSHAGVTVTRVQRVENPNYLFVDLTIAPSASPGRVRLAFSRKGRQEARHDFALLAREPGSADRQGFNASDALYLITPDRFANGDPGNDAHSGYREKPDRAQPYGRHGGDLQGILDHLDYIASMGFTQIWLNPVLENDQPEASYHGYAITDFYRVDARFGDNELFRRLARTARERNIGMIMDVIPNHVGHQHWWMKDPPTRDWINHGGQFVANSHNHEAVHDPHGTEADRRSLVDGWFVETMPDLNQRNPFLATYLTQNAIWWIEYTGLSGLRVDTWPYSDRDFLAAWTKRLRAEYPKLNIVGEEWSLNPALVAHWQNRKWADGYEANIPSLMDFPLQDAAVRAFTETDGFNQGLPRLYNLLGNDFSYSDPYNLVVFPDNHDMNRIFTQLGERMEWFKLTYLFFATTRGIPQYYYGSEILKTSPKERHDGLLRSDFPGGWAGDKVNGFTGAGLTSQQREAQDFTRQLLNWRKGQSAIHRGKLTHYAPDKGTYVYFRADDRQALMIALNKGEERRLDTARFHEAIGASTHAKDIITGKRIALADGVTVPARGFALLELEQATAAPIPEGVTGKIEHHEGVKSKYVDPRNVDVWLPPSYGKETSKRYPVVYVHDGQNLFDPALSYTRVDWGIDETMTRLIGEGKAREAIVVGIWNTPKRVVEYVPQKAVPGGMLTGDLLGADTLRTEQLQSDAYLRFLVEELKPFIDSKYRTLTDRANTFTMGSSAGALISAYAVAEYPNVFGGAGCLSTHWPLGKGMMIDYLEKHMPPPGHHKWYFDHGTLTLDQYYEVYQKRMDAVMRRKGYREGVDWITVKDEGAEHNEQAWRARVEVPLVLFLGK